PVTGMGTGVAEVRARGHRTFARKDDGTVWGWGYGCDGGVGSDTAQCSMNTTPLQIQNVTNATKLAAGWDASCALKADGTVWCWGPNWFGQVGDGSYTTRFHPVQVV